MLSFSRSARAVVLGCVVTGCTSVLGIDGDYELKERVQGDQDGSTGAGGATAGGGSSIGVGGANVAGRTSGGASNGGAETGGAEAGGVPTGGDDSGQAGSGGANAGCPVGCGANEKCCLDHCLVPSPLIGCSVIACDPCPPPPDQGVAICNGAVCGVRCNPGFEEQSGDCVPSAAGGAGGATAAGGSTSTGGTGAGGGKCVPANCTKKCNIAGPLHCCLNDNTCGCTWAPPFCYLPN